MAANGSERRTTWCTPPALEAETGPLEGPRPVSALGGCSSSASVGDDPYGPPPQRADDGPAWTEVRRDVNLRICELAERWGADNDVFSFLCECGDPACSETVGLLPRVYAEARRKDRVVARAHAPRGARGTVARH